MPFIRKSGRRLSRHVITPDALTRASRQVTAEMAALGMWCPRLDGVDVWLVPVSFCFYGWFQPEGDIYIPAVTGAQLSDYLTGHHTRLPVTVQSAMLDPRPSRRPGWNGVSATAFLNQVNRRSLRGTVFSLGITAENIVPGAAWNYLFGYAYLGLPSCVVSLCEMSTDRPALPRLVKLAATIAIHEIGHNCGLDHHGYDEASPAS